MKILDKIGEFLVCVVGISILLLISSGCFYGTLLIIKNIMALKG